MGEDSGEGHSGHVHELLLFLLFLKIRWEDERRSGENSGDGDDLGGWIGPMYLLLRACLVILGDSSMMSIQRRRLRRHV